MIHDDDEDDDDEDDDDDAGMLRMGWYSQGHKFGLIDGNRWEQPWAQSGLPAQNTALVLCICVCICACVCICICVFAL